MLIKQKFEFWLTIMFREHAVIGLGPICSPLLAGSKVVCRISINLTNCCYQLVKAAVQADHILNRSKCRVP